MQMQERMQQEQELVRDRVLVQEERMLVLVLGQVLLLQEAVQSRLLAVGSICGALCPCSLPCLYSEMLEPKQVEWTQQMEPSARPVADINQFCRR